MATCRALDYCELYALTRADLEEVFYARFYAGGFYVGGFPAGFSTAFYTGSYFLVWISKSDFHVFYVKSPDFYGFYVKSVKSNLHGFYFVCI